MEQIKVKLTVRDLKTIGAFEVDGGRYNDHTKKREHNVYHARMTKGSKLVPCKTDQGVNSAPYQGVNFDPDQGVSSDPIKERKRKTEIQNRDLKQKSVFLSGFKQGSGRAREAAPPGSKGRASAASPPPTATPAPAALNPPPLPAAPPPEPGVPASAVAAVVRDAVAGVQRIQPAVNTKLYQPAGRSPPASPPEGRVVMPGEELDWVEDWCLATGARSSRRTSKVALRFRTVFGSSTLSGRTCRPNNAA
jgi:hypothetical protein